MGSTGGLLEGKRALITGASRGIGACVAVNYAMQGAHLVLVARTKEHLDKVGMCLHKPAAWCWLLSKPSVLKLSVRQQVAEECKKAGAKEVDVRPCSLADGAAVQKLAEGVLADYGHIDVLVNAAGAFEYSGALEGHVPSFELSYFRAGEGMSCWPAVPAMLQALAQRNNKRCYSCCAPHD